MSKTFQELRFCSRTNFMGERRIIYYGPLIKVSLSLERFSDRDNISKILKESGKELYAFLFNDVLLFIEAAQANWSEIFVTKIRTFSIYKYVRCFELVKLYTFSYCADFWFAAHFVGHDPKCAVEGLSSQHGQFVPGVDR
jgi:hypothetical protein